MFPDPRWRSASILVLGLGSHSDGGGADDEKVHTIPSPRQRGSKRQYRVEYVKSPPRTRDRNEGILIRLGALGERHQTT